MTNTVARMSSDDLSDVSVLAPPPRRRRRLATAFLAVAALACLAVAVASGIAAVKSATRAPTPAQRAAAAATAEADRWRTLTAGQIFPAEVSYSTSLLTTESAIRVAIGVQTACASAVDPAFSALATHDHCQAGLRATYLDQLQGILYTIGVLAFPTAHRAEAFSAGLSADHTGVFGLRPLAQPGTASSLFSPEAGQAATTRQAGPFVILTVAGYADGQPAGSGQEARPEIFAPAAQLAAKIAAPLGAPIQVNCRSPQWSC
jgi:hypothetical protein